MSGVAFLDLQRGVTARRAAIDAAIGEVLDSGYYIGGPHCTAFEASFAQYCGAAHCVGVANGLDALQLGLRALGVGAGDEVIVSSNGYIATWLAVSAIGAVPVPVEPDPATHNLDPARVAAAITARTRVILPTHLYGQPADLDPLLSLAANHGLKLLEDAAQAHGARYHGQRLGGHGDLVAWSFYPSKNLGALGDGGAVTTNDGEIAARVRKLGNYGSDVRYVNPLKGVNSRLDPLQAAVLSVKLETLEAENTRRQQIAAHYNAELADTPLILPAAPNWAKPVWHIYAVRSPRRDALRDRLAAAAIGTLIHYPIPPHLQGAYAEMGLVAGSFPIAEQLAREVLSLPINPHMSDDEVARVIAGVKHAA